MLLLDMYRIVLILLPKNSSFDLVTHAWVLLTAMTLVFSRLLDKSVSVQNDFKSSRYLCRHSGELEINTMPSGYSNIGLSILVKHASKPHNISMQVDVSSMKDIRDHVLWPFGLVIDQWHFSPLCSKRWIYMGVSHVGGGGWLLGMSFEYLCIFMPGLRWSQLCAMLPLINILLIPQHFIAEQSILKCTTILFVN